MTNEKTFDRRTILCAGVAAAVLPAGTVSAAPDAKDPDIDAMFTRLTKVATRGASLSVKQKYIVLLATLTSVGSPASMQKIAAAALRDGVTASVVKEAVYQCTPYVGISRVEAVLPAVNAALEAAGVALPLKSEAAVTDADRFEKGLAVQTGIFGEGIAKMHKGAEPGERPLIVDDLSGWCFGDFYTRKCLDVKERELATFSAIAALGGCEPQLGSHAAANISVGNTRQNLIDALHIAVPFLGFPRTLNALAVVKKTAAA